MILTQDHISEFKVAVHTFPKSVSEQLLFTTMWDIDNIFHNCFPNPRVRNMYDID